MLRKAFLVCGLFVGLGAGAATAAAAESAPWPCAQPRTPTISAASVWAGPDIAKAGDWQNDSEAAALAQELASRRTPLSNVDGLLDAFVKKVGPADKDLRLTRVFAGALALINDERDKVVSGISRFAEGQQLLAERVRKDGENVADDQQDGPSKAKALADAQTKFAWDKRIFTERSQSLKYVCETPGILEHRIFVIARSIQQRL
jgi:hypothetical protein